MILAIDPGNIQSAYVLYNHGEILEMGKYDNYDILAIIGQCPYSLQAFAVEMVASYGMAVGKEVFETCLWVGRFVERWGDEYELIYRKDIKMHLCGSMRAKDTNIRQALLDRFPASGGGKVPQVGTKAKPGPLFGVHSDIWSALAIAVYCEDKTIMP